jgi:hypothetical protein
MKKENCYSELTRSFEAHEVDNNSFHHAEHVQVAFELLDKYDFIDATSIYAKGIRALATDMGVPQKFNLTITYAFMSLIAERMVDSSASNFEDFMELNPDLMSKTILTKWYSADRLSSEIARNVFLMPVPIEVGLANVS